MSNCLKKWRLAANLKPNQVDRALLELPGTTIVYEKLGIQNIPLYKIPIIAEIYRVSPLKVLRAIDRLATKH